MNEHPPILDFMPGADRWRRVGGEWHGPCPACGGDDRCRLYTDGDAGRDGGGRYACRACDASGDSASLYIDAGHTYEDAARRFGLPLATGAPAARPAPRAAARPPRPAPPSASRPPATPKADAPAKARKTGPPTGAGSVDTWTYADADGYPLFRVRFTRRDDDGRKHFTQERAVLGEGRAVRFASGMSGADGVPVRRVLYRLPDVLDAAAGGRVVVVVEGEACADALAHAFSADGIGRAVTTSPGGCGAWRDEYADAFNGIRAPAFVAILPDNDDGGRKHAAAVAASCAARGVPVRIVPLTMPGGDAMPHGGDVADVLAAGGTADDVRAAIDAAPEYAPGDDLDLDNGAGETPTAPEPPAPKPRATAAGRLVELVTTSPGAALWHTDDGAEYATVLRTAAPSSSTDGAPAPPAAPRPEHLPIRSKAFRDFLALVYYRAEGRPPGGQAVQDAVDQLAGIARFDGPTHRTALRCVTTDGGRVVWIDIGGDSPDAVRIDAAGWAIVPAHACPVRLLRRPNGAAFPVPERADGAATVADRLARLWDFVTVKEERDRAMLLGWMLHAMRGAGRYPVLSFAGEAGSGKSTAARLVRALLDPNAVPLRGVPRDEQSLYIAATNNHVLTMDNVSGLSVEMSDALCRLALGGGLSVRQLYTADEERTFQAERPVVLTSVADIVARQDLVDRTLCVTLRRIGETARRSDGDLDEAFARAAPGIFGALLDALALALRAWPSVAPGGARRPARLPRMAEFALWGAASEEALGLPPGGFGAAYERSRADLVGATLDGDPLADAVRTLADRAGAGRMRATASEMLNLVTDTAGLADAPARRLPPGWPRTANVLSRQLREMAVGLRAVGVAVDFARDSGHGRARYIVLTLTDADADAPPPETDRDDAPGLDLAPGGDGAAPRVATAHPDAPRLTPTPAPPRPAPPRPVPLPALPFAAVATAAGEARTPVPVPSRAPLPPAPADPHTLTTATGAPGTDEDDPFAED